MRVHTINDVLEILGESPKLNGLHVFNKIKITKIPFDHPFRSEEFAIILVLSGRLKIQLNLITYILETNDIIVIVPRTVTHILEIEGDLQFIGISFTLDFALKNLKTNDMEAFDFFASKTILKISVQIEEIETFIMLSNLLQLKNANINPLFFGREMVFHTFNLLIYELGTLYKKKYSDLKTELSRQEELTLKFLKILENNFNRERSVQFYADALFLTTGHLTKVLKEVSGKTAGELINDAVIIQARILLSNQSLTIAQIANELQFSDQSFFGKYFKKNTGVSPSVYRRKKFESVV